MHYVLVRSLLSLHFHFWLAPKGKINSLISFGPISAVCWLCLVCKVIIARLCDSVPSKCQSKHSPMRSETVCESCSKCYIRKKKCYLRITSPQELLHNSRSMLYYHHVCNKNFIRFLYNL